MHLTKSIFAENLNTRFWLLNEQSEPHAIDLVEFTEDQASPQLEQFSLRFRCDCTHLFPQRTYTMKHDAIGDFDLFLVPIGSDKTGTFYEAVFNRLIPVQTLEQVQ